MEGHYDEIQITAEGVESVLQSARNGGIRHERMTKEQARRFLLLKHGLLGERRFEGSEGAYGFIRQAGSIQFDPIDVCGRNADLVLQSRVLGYKKQVLDDLLYRQRRLVDYFDKELCIFPAEDWPRFSFMRDIRGGWMRSHDRIGSARDAVIEEIRKRGPLCSKDFASKDKVHWFWGPSSLPRAALEHLYYAGQLGIHHKRGTTKYYDLIERCIPEELTIAPSGFENDGELYSFLLRRRIGAVGLMWNRASAVWLGFPDFRTRQRNHTFDALMKSGDIKSVNVDGIRDNFYMLSSDEPLMNTAKTCNEDTLRCELIAPLDNLLWDRKLIETLFDFTYTWEIYVPQAKRKYGYYVLPVLFGERFIGRAEPLIDKKTGELEIKNLWFEPGIDKGNRQVRMALDESLARFEGFHKLSIT